VVSTRKWTKTGTALLILLAASHGFAQVTPDEFTDKFIQALKQSHPDVTTDVNEPLQLKAANADGREVVAYLNNAYELYLQDTDELDAVLERYVVALMATMTADEAPPLSLANIVPVVKDSAWLAEALAAIKPEIGTTSPEYYQTSFVEGLSIIYAEDTPSNIRYIEKASIEELGVDIATIPATAIVNLLAKLPDISVDGGEGLYMVIADGNYEASLLLVDDIWTHQNFDVAGDIVVALPARDVLLVSGTGNTEQLEQLQALAKQVYAESTYNLTSNIDVRRNGRWEVFAR